MCSLKVGRNGENRQRQADDTKNRLHDRISDDNEQLDVGAGAANARRRPFVDEKGGRFFDRRLLAARQRHLVSASEPVTRRLADSPTRQLADLTARRARRSCCASSGQQTAAVVSAVSEKVY